MLTLQRWACSAGIWAGLAALQRPLRRLVRFSPWLSRARTPVLSGVVTVVVSPVTYLLHAYGLLLALAFVAALAWASREPAPSVA